MKILYKGNIYDVSNELTKQQFLNNGGKIYVENITIKDTAETIETIEPKKSRGRKKRTE